MACTLLVVLLFSTGVLREMLQRVDYDQCIYHVKQNNLQIKRCVQIVYWKCSTSFFFTYTFAIFSRARKEEV